MPAGPGRPPKSLATTFGANKISTDVQGGVDLALDGAFDLNGKYGALRVFIRGDLANLVLQGSGLSVGTRKLNLAELALSFAYAGQKQTLRVNLANLLLNKFKFKLGG